MNDPWQQSSASADERLAYALAALPFHLAAAQKFDALKQLLLKAHFLEAKLASHGPQMLIADYDFLQSAPGEASTALTEVQEALRQASHILTDEANQLAPQLFGRVLKGRSSEIDLLLDGLKPSFPWLRPLVPSLAESRVLRVFRHNGAVYGLVVTQDGQQIAAGANSIKVWNVKDGIETFEIPGSDALVMELLTYGDLRQGQRLVSVDQTGNVGVFNLRTGARERTLKTLGGVKAAALTSDGRFLIAAPDAVYAEIWDLQTSSRVSKLEDPKAPQLFVSWQLAEAGLWDWDGRGHRKTINCVAISHDDQHVFTGSDDKQLIAWAIASSRVVWQRVCPEPVKAVIEVRPGTIIYALQNGAILGQQGPNFQEEFVVGQHKGAQSLAVSSDGSLLASGAQDGSITLWNIEDLRHIGTLAGNVERRADGIIHLGITKLSFIPGLSNIASTSADGFVKLWHLPHRENSGIGALQNHAERSQRIRAKMDVISQDGWTLLGVSNEGIALTDLRNGNTQFYAGGSEGEVTVLAVTPNGNTFAAGCENGDLIVGNLGDGHVKAVSLGKDSLSAVTLTADGRNAFVTLENRMIAFDLRRWATVRTVSLPFSGIDRLLLSRDEGTLFAASTRDSLILAYGIRTETVTGTLKDFGDVRPPAGVLMLRTTRGEAGVRYIYYSQDSDGFGVWNPESERNSFRLKIRKGGRSAISVCGTWAAFETRNHCVQIVDIARRRLGRLLDGHHEYLTSLRFTADSSRLVTCSADGGVAMWNLDGSVYRRFVAREGSVEGAITTPDNSGLISGNENGLLTLWDVRSGDSIAHFRIDAPIEPRHVTPDGRTIVATDAMSGVHLLAIENFQTMGVHVAAQTTQVRKGAMTERLLAGWQWRRHLRSGAAASDRRDWSIAEREYRAAAESAEILNSAEKLARVLDSLEFVIGMRKNDEILSARGDSS